ncbi:MAG: SLBB domain-containing protein, partial [Gammaproteobacteria bacterium]
DVIKVTLRGLTESDASYKLGRDGNLILPTLAPLNISGLTIFEAEEKLLNVLRYDDAAAAVFMSLDTARLITVQVSGAVENPRTLAIPAFTPLSRVLAYAGGIKPTGSLRNIILRDRDGGLEKVDFYDFLQSPVGANDPLVTDSSRIFIGNQGKTVAAIGFVARPGIYELDTESNDISVLDL